VILRKVLALIALSALPLATPSKGVQAATAVKPQPLPIQTVTFNTWELPAYVDITPATSGLTYDVFMTSGACTQQSINASTPRVAFQVAQYTQQLTAYGTYCIYVNAWTSDYGYMTATILTTIKVVQVAAPKAANQANTYTYASQINNETAVHNEAMSDTPTPSKITNQMVAVLAIVMAAGMTFSAFFLSRFDHDLKLMSLSAVLSLGGTLTGIAGTLLVGVAAYKQLTAHDLPAGTSLKASEQSEINIPKE
jgi:hypothetical protein